MRLEFNTRVSRRAVARKGGVRDYIEYVVIPKEVRGNTSLYGKTVHVIIEVIEKEEGNNKEEEKH